MGIMMMPLCVLVGLSSCHSPLVAAVKRGDIAGVKQEISAGASSFEINRAANAACRQGNSAIIDELVKAGAVVAPENAAGLVFVLQVDKKGETNTPTPQVPDALRDKGSISPAIYWQPVRWTAPTADDGCRLRELKWAANQSNSFEKESSDSDGRYHDSQSYTRLSRDCAVLYDSSSMWLNGGYSTAASRWFKYELDFETPTSGSFYGYDGDKYCNLVQLKGRFWIKNKSTGQKSADTGINAPSSVKGKKIVMDFSSAQRHQRMTGDTQWGAWQKCGNHTITTRAFGSNNKCLNEKEGGEVCYWSYKKTGPQSASLDNGISGESGLGFPTSYTLTFDSATTGTAVEQTGEEGMESETTGIRFSIK